MNAMSSEEPFFFDERDGSLYAVYFAPRGQAKGEAFVLCNGFAGEHVICRAHLAHFARALAAKGYGVLRFDCAGYGDSQGDFERASITSMTSDILAAVEVLRRRGPFERVGLVGVRFGATLAVLAATEAQTRGAGHQPSRLILWEPILELWSYVFAELRQTVAMQTLLFRDVRLTRDQIVENVLAGKPSLVDGYDMNCIDDGYPLGREFVEQAKAVDLSGAWAKISVPTLIVNVKKKEGPPAPKLLEIAGQLKARGVSAEIVVAVEPALPWLHERFFMTRSPDVYQRTLNWIDGEHGRPEQRHGA
jgi:pimeloyl-ACP methyl ester carboxylesterase